MNTITTTHISLATLAVVAAAVLFLLPTSFANAQCPTPSAMGLVSVTHGVCSPAGVGICTGAPDKPGHDGYPCAAKNTLGGTIKGTCKAGCCTVIAPSTCAVPSFGDSSGAIKAAGGNLVGGLATGAGLQLGMQLIQSLLGGLGGGGGGGGGSSYPSHQTPTTDPDTLLGFDNTDLQTTLSDENLGILDTIFGGGQSTETTQDTTDTTNETGGGTQTSVDNTGSETNPDGVVTTYESVAENPLVGDGVQSDTYTATQQDIAELCDGDDEFDCDFFGASFDDSDDLGSTNGLSLAQLEALGLLEAQRQGANGDTHSGSLSVPYESLTPAEIKTLQDYHSSAVAVSGNLAPSFDSDYDAADDEDQKGFLARLLAFLAAVLGLGAPQSAN